MMKTSATHDRLSALAASLFFSLPTSALLWFMLNAKLATFSAQAYLTSDVFWLSVLGFSAVALLAPALFPSLMGATWRGILALARWVV